MKKFLVIVATGLIALGTIGSVSSTAQEPPLDVGEIHLYSVACAYATTQAVTQNVVLKWCRQNGEPEIIGTRAKVPLRVKITNLGTYIVEVTLFKSLWSVHTWNVQVE